MQLDEEAAGAILRPLDEDPHIPSTIDVRRAVTEGRRRRRAQRIGAYAATAGVTALAVAAGTIIAGGWRSGAPPTEPGASTATSPAPPAQPAPPAAPTQCTLHQLALPDGRVMALVTGGDPTGRYLLGRTYPADASSGPTMDLHLVIWDRLRPTLITMPGDDQAFDDVNSSGVAVGNSYNGDGTTAYSYRDGKTSKLPGGDGASVRAINEAGAAVGTKGDKPVLWRGVDQPPVELALPPGVKVGGAVDIDDDGTVLGNVGDFGNQQPYVWAPDGTGRPLSIPTAVASPPSASADPRNGGKTGVSKAIVYSIRDGWVTGRVWTTAVRWNLRTGDVRMFPDLQMRADAVNRYGWQVGLDAQGRAVFWSDTGRVMLPELAKHDPGGLTNIPNTISDDGTVIGGQSDDQRGTIRAVVWTCT